MFKDINKEHTAKQALLTLQQKGAVTMYIAEFQMHSFRTD
jgi:hypothetical protein